MGDYSTIHVSGHVGNDASGKVTTKNFAEEVDICFANIARALERSGAGMKDVVRITCYLTDLADYPVYSKARARAVQGQPASQRDGAGRGPAGERQDRDRRDRHRQEPLSLAMALNSIEETYRARTTKSAALLKRAAQQPARRPYAATIGYYPPYPVVHQRGEGPYLWDVDGNRYVDLNYNGLSLIHGHAYRAGGRGAGSGQPRGWAWLGTSRPQIEFAETLCGRIKIFERVLFTNSGTEASMLAVKLARGFTKRPLILKAHGGYHGTYSDLEAGLHGQGEIPGHTLLAEFNNADSFERVLERHGQEIAAVVLEPVMYTGVVMPALPGFLDRVQAAANRPGALFVLDDCLMFRLALGGSAEKFGLSPDITFLGKFIGGGIAGGRRGGARARSWTCADPARGGDGSITAAPSTAMCWRASPAGSPSNI